jgi:hypothetical protein
VLTLLILVVVLILLFGGAFWATPSYGPYVSWSPFLLILLLLIVLWALGIIHT